MGDLMSNNLNNLEWKDNSFNMYKAILNAAPSFFRGGINNSIENWIYKNKISIVTEDLVFKAVDEIAPANIANNMIKPELNKLRTK